MAVITLIAITFSFTNCQCLPSPLQATSYVHARDERDTIQYHGEPSSLFTETGLTVHRGQRVTVEYLYGGWNTQPGFVSEGPEGHPGTKASSAYLMPGYPKGMLVTRVGNGRMMPWTAPRLTFIADAHGEIEFGINDLVRDQAGRNNHGRLKMRVTIHQHPSSADKDVDVEHWYLPRGAK